MKSFRTMLFLFTAVILLFGTIGNAFGQVNYNDEFKTLEAERKKKKSMYGSNDILYYLDRGMVNHYLGKYADSSKDLIEAERLIEEAFTKSLTQGAASFIGNDNAKSYAGEDYEDIYINVFNALNSYHNNDLENALVEIRRVNEKLDVMADKYEKAMAKAKEADDKVKDVALDTEASKFSNSALAQYLTILFSRAEGNADNIRIGWEQMQRAYSLAPNIYGAMPATLRTSVQAELNVPKTTARLNVLAFSGLSPVKEEERITIPLPFFPAPNNTAPLNLPKMIARPSNIQYVEVVVGDQKLRLDLVEDMSKVAIDTFKSKYSLIVTKTTARTIMKTAASGAAATAASKKGGLAGLAVGVAGKIATEASENPDLRISKHFPEKAHAGGINLAPGTYSVTFNYHGQGGSLIGSMKVDNVKVEAGKLNLVQSRL